MNAFLWRPVLAGLGTLMEVKHRWTLEDVLDAHELLDLQQEAAQLAPSARPRR